MVYQTGPNLFLPKGHDCETWRCSGRNILVGDWTHGALRFDEVNILVDDSLRCKKKHHGDSMSLFKKQELFWLVHFTQGIFGNDPLANYQFHNPSNPQQPNPSSNPTFSTHAPENVLIISRISGHSRGRTMADLMGIWWWDHPLEPSGMDPEIFSTFLPSKVAIVGHFLGRYTTWVIGESWTHWIGKPFSTNLYI